MKQRHIQAYVRLTSLFLVGMALVFSHARTALGVEVEIGEATIPPGVTLIFEGAMPDDITPHAQNLAQEKTDVHLEVRANWATEGAVPDGAPRGGFVAYLNMHAQVENEQTGQVLLVTLMPHIVLGDSFHYARNVALPGGTNHRYTITFFVNPPDPFALAFHSNWREQFGSTLIQEHVFTFHGVDFSAVVER
jgi:periplasmic iron binding protein